MCDPRAPLRAVLLFCVCCPGAFASPVFINEFHYDNTGSDVGEFVEIAGPSGTDLGGWRLLLVNGSNGLPYGQHVLSGVLGDDTGSGFGFHLVSLPSNGLQNGPPDGLALLDADNGVREFLSYEGVITGVGDALLGLISDDVQVMESGATPIGASLQRMGRGDRAADFSWQAATVATAGRVNRQQQLVASTMTLDTGPTGLLGLPGLLWLAGRRRRR